MSFLDSVRTILKKPTPPPAAPMPTYTPQVATKPSTTLPPLTKRPRPKLTFDRNITPIRDQSNVTVIPIYTENPFGRKQAAPPGSV